MKKTIKLIFNVLLTTVIVNSESFFVLNGVNNYDPIVVNNVQKIDKSFVKELKKTMIILSKEANIKVDGHPSRVLALVINQFSIGETIGINLKLDLGEYLFRKGSKEEIFVISYEDSKSFLFDDEFEESLEDAFDEMMDKFIRQYRDDNKKFSKTKIVVTHENFANYMSYEIDYYKALIKAKKENKPLFIFMTTSYCPWCRKLENRILVQDDIDKKIKEKFIPVMLNFDKKNFPKSLHKIGFTPTLYIINEKTQKIENTFVGYSSRGEFLDKLK